MATQAPRTDEAGSLDLVRRAVDEGSRLVQQEVLLARQEIRDMTVSAVTGVALAAVAAVAAVGCLVLAVVALIVAVPAHWVAALALAGALLIGAVLAGGVALGRLRRLGPPRQTIETIKEDAEWARRQLRREKN